MNKKHNFLVKYFTNLFALFLMGNLVYAQNTKPDSGYVFTPNIEIPSTCVKNQASSGTCWSFATTSFIESEIIRMNKGEHDLSEMFFVRYAYPNKAEKYVRYHGMANFSQGGQAHDVLNTIREYGLVPEEAYIGINYESNYHKHGELVDILSGILNKALANKEGFSGKYIDVINATLDIYLGETPQQFVYKANEYTPHSFAEYVGFNPNNYVEFTSYNNYPFYEAVDLEVPDNWSHDLYYNIPIDELMQVINNAFKNGFSVNWDGDVSERGFSHKKGIAIVPDSEPKNLDENEQAKWELLSESEKKQLLYDFSKPRSEKQITQDLRQNAFDKFKITDDHLMHLIGTATDQKGTTYYITKNSWSKESNKLGGKLYMSETYLRLATIAILVHKDAIPDKIKNKCKIN